MQAIISWIIARPLRITGLLLLIFAIAFVLRIEKPEPKEIVMEPVLPRVSLISSSEYSGEKSISTIGSVRAVSEAKVTTERAGRVTAVNVTLGQSVSAGTVLLTLENEAEQASVLQAEGAYQGAKAAASQTNLTISEANTNLTAVKKSAITTVQSAYNTVNGVIFNNVDRFYTQPNTPLPGLNIGGRGYRSELDKERVAYQSILPAWQERIAGLTPEDNIEVELQLSKETVERTIKFIDVFIFVFEGSTNDSYLEYKQQFTTVRESLIALSARLDGAQNSVKQATDALKRAEVIATGSESSVADAQVTQALAGLRLAQSNLNKTILRTPISGTISKLDVKKGDFVSVYQMVVEVTNQSGKEVITYVSTADVVGLPVGTKVTIDGSSTGIVSAVSPAVDSGTGKVEVRISTNSDQIRIGDTVRVFKLVEDDKTDTTEVRVPLSAVKFEATNGYVLMLSDEKLTERPVVIGEIKGESVVIKEGLQSDEMIVSDARGLQAGMKVVIGE